MDKIKKFIVPALIILIMIGMNAVSAIRKEPDAADNASSQSQSQNDESAEPDEESETSLFKGLKIGTSNIIILAVLGGAIGINKIKEIKAGKMKSKD